MKNLWRSKNGSSLIEILVVMVVLLVGIMTVVKIFPLGFGVVKAAESQTIATRLAQREIEKWKSMPASLPLSILPIDDAGVIAIGQYPGPPFEAFEKDSKGKWIKNAGDYVRGNVLNIRQVFGETTTIPVASYFQTGAGTGYGSRYTLAFSPIEANVQTDSSGNVTIDEVAVKSGDMLRRRGDSDVDPPYLRAGSYAIDYGDGTSPSFKVAFPRQTGPNSPLYYISYSYWVQTASHTLELRSKLDDPVNLPANYDGDWVAVDVPSLGTDETFVEIEDGSDSCARGFRPISGTFTLNDPYEYSLADPIMGVVAFNPVSHDMFEYTAQGLKPIIARIDYRIYDPRIIRDDRVISQPGNGAVEIPVKLSLKFLLNAGEPADITDGDVTDNPDEPTFEGLVRGKIGHEITSESELRVAQSVLIIDLATGLRVALPNNRITVPTESSINFKAGKVYLPLTADLIDNKSVTVMPGVALAGRHLRFFYRADGDWSVQCQKACSLYLREWGTANLDYRHYNFVGLNRLTFAPCEAGKTVAVDYTYTLDGVEHKVTGEACKISEETFAVGPSFYCYADLKVPAGGTINRIAAVVGVSFRVRVIWRDESHWRYVDMDTSLLKDSMQ